MVTSKPRSRTVASLLDEAGGVPAVAAALGNLPYMTVKSWKERGRIPVEYWTRFMTLAKSVGVKGLSNEELIALHTPPGSEALVAKGLRPARAS